MPGVSLSRHEIRVRASEPRVLDRLMDIEHEMVSGGRFNDALVMFHHVLAVVPFEPVGNSVGVERSDVLTCTDVAGLDGVHAERLVQGECVLELGFVVGDAGGCLVVADQSRPPGQGIGGDRFEIEVRIWLREAESSAIVEPVSVPAPVPALDQDAVEPVLGGKVDVALGILGRCTMAGALSPRRPAHVHLPPDPHVLPGMYPCRVGDAVRLVQVENEIRRDEVSRRLSDLNGSPRSLQRGARFHLHAVGPWHEVRLESRGADALQRHG